MIKRYSNITLWLIGINIIFFLISIILISIYPQFIYSIALQPSSFLHGKFWTIITSMFMHGDVSHLFMNMFSLIFLGSFLERLIGSRRFLAIYFVSGIVAGIFFILFSFFPLNSVPGLGVSEKALAVGASGAIFGVAGMLAILTPRMPIYVMFIPVAMPMWFGVILILLVFTLLSAFAGLPIGNSAHLGGLVAGVIYALYLKNKYKKKARIIAKFYS
ncbi:MAG: rhomboid family intramembrane serine protease [Candidatus Pacearchaeota archaeon]